MTEAKKLIEAHGLQPHPEGGWYRETWRGPEREGRATATMIHFLLEADQSSHWHRVDADELWLWHAGDPLALRVAESEDAAVETMVLGDSEGPVRLWQGVVPQGQWQAATPLPGPAGYVFVSCIVAPGFEFEGFELASPGWAPKRA
ncbi:MAG: cupin [Citromicrobium sp.]|nr:cupin [Citromicrobium sp.]